MNEHDEEIWAAADEAAAAAADAPEGAGKAGPQSLRGYDKRIVYGIGAAVLALFIGFSFIGGDPSPASSPPPVQPSAAAESGPIIADPPYAAAQRTPPLGQSDSSDVALVPPPSSSVIGGADGRPYAAVGAGAPPPPSRPPANDPAGESPGVPPGVAAALDEDPRRQAWKAVRDAAPTSGWERAGGGSVDAFSVDSASWDPELARPVPADDASAVALGAFDTASVTHPAQGRGATITVPALTRIEAALVTAVNSEVAGDVVAAVTRDVLDVTGRRVAIPAGSLLLGRQSDQVAVGQRRVVIAWSSLHLPDRTVVPLPGLPAADENGAAGLSGQVSSGAAGAFGRALLLSAIGAGFQLSQPQSGDGATPSAGRAAAAAVGQQLAELSAELLRRDVNTRPTIRLQQGAYVTVLVARELAVPSRRWARADGR